MITLVITVCLLALGKIVAQETPLSPVVYTQPLPSHVSYTNGQRQFNHQSSSLSPSPVQLTNTRQPLTNRGSDANLPPAVRESQPRRLFISRIITETMNELRPFEKNTNENHSLQENKSDVHDSIDYEKPASGNQGFLDHQVHLGRVMTSSGRPVHNIPVPVDFGHVKNHEETNYLRNPHVVAAQTITPVPLPDHEAKTNKPAIAPGHVHTANTTEVTLDERSNFDGDQCPTGYVRVAGMCVLPE